MLAMEAGGADVIELGVPFTDSTADGPVVQDANTVCALSWNKVLCFDMRWVPDCDQERCDLYNVLEICSGSAGKRVKGADIAHGSVRLLLSKFL